MPLILGEWKGEQYKKLLTTSLDKKMQVIGVLLTNELKQELNKTGNIDGDTPSEPGEPPAKVTGRLASSVTYIYDQAAKVLRVGSNVLYSKFLELGTVKMNARPWLRPVFYKNMNRIREILQSPSEGSGGAGGSGVAAGSAPAKVPNAARSAALRKRWANKKQQGKNHL